MATFNDGDLVTPKGGPACVGVIIGSVVNRSGVTMYIMEVTENNPGFKYCVGTRSAFDALSKVGGTNAG